MSDDWYNVHQLAMLTGFRLIVPANRVGCEDEFLLELDDGLAEGLAAAIARLPAIMALEHRLATEPDDEGLVALQLHGEEECFARFQITLLGDLEIDCDNHEYRVNGGEWHNALSADCDGVEINYPSLVDLTDDELDSWLRSYARSATTRTSVSTSHASSTIDALARGGFGRLWPPLLA